MAYSFEEFKQLAKIWNNGQQTVKNEQLKTTNPAPKYGNTIPKLEAVRKSQIMQGTDPASKSMQKYDIDNIKATDVRNLDRKQEAKLKSQVKKEKKIKQERAKELNNVSKNLGTNDIARYNRQFSLDKPMQDIDMDKLRQAQYNKARNDKKVAEMEADRKAEADARQSANRKRVESEVKSLQSKGDLRTMQEDERLNFLLESAEKRGMVNKKNPYLVSRNRYNSLMQSGRLANDIEPLAMALSNGSGAQMSGTRQILDAGYNSVDDYIDQLSKRYELTPAEVKDVVKTYLADRLSAQEEKEYNALYNLGQEHPQVGTALSILASPAAGVEGWYNTAANATTGDDRNQSAIFSNLANAPKEGRLSELDNNALKLLYNIGVGGAGIALNAKGGLGAIAAMGGNASNEAMNAAIERGVAPEKAAQLGALAGIADTAFNAQGFNAIDDALKADTVRTVKDFVRNIGVGAGTEAMENVAQDITETVADEILNREQSELRTAYQNYIKDGVTAKEAFKQTTLDYAEQLGTSAGTGAIAGGLFSGAEMGKQLGKKAEMAVAGRILENQANKRSAEVQDRVKTYEEAKQTELPRVGGEPSLVAEQPKVEDTPSGMDVPHELAERYAMTYSDFDDYGAIDNYAEMDGFVEQMADDIANGRDLSEYISTLEDSIEDAPDDRIKANMEAILSDLQKLNTNAVNDSDAVTNTVNEPTVYANESKNRAYQRYNDLRKHIDNRRLSKVKFDNDADAKAYDTARKDLFRAVSEYANAVENAKSDADIVNAAQRVEDASRVLNEAGKKGYVNDKANQTELRKIKKDFYEKTKGTVINIPAEMRGEAGLKDKTMRMLNSALSTLGGNDHIKFSSKGGTPIDVVWNELVSASGNALDINTSNNADMVAQLLDYVDGLKVDGKGVERVPANTYDYAGDDLFDAISQMNTEASNRVNNPTPTEPIDNSNVVMAEDIGLNDNESDDDYNITYKIEEEPEPTGAYKEEGTSDYMTNTAVNAGIVNAEQIKNDPQLAEIAKKDRHSNKQTFDAAMKIAEKEGNSWTEDVISGKRVLGGEKENSDLDFDTGMIVLQDLAYQLDNAKTDAEKQAITAKRNALLSKMTEFSSNAGRTLQAHVKWNNTADGAIMNGNKMLGDATQTWVSHNAKGQVKQNMKLANALKLLGYDGSMDNIPKEPVTIDELRNRVRNTLSKEFSSIEKQFSDSDIEYLTNLIQSGATTKELTDALNMKMATGRFGISAETQAEVNRLYDYMLDLDPESKDYADAQLEAFRLIAKETVNDATGFDKFDAWRYLAMLGNPKTMIRNWLGNKMSAGIIGFSNTAAAIAEEVGDRSAKAMGKEGLYGGRTKAVLNPFGKDKELIRLSKDDFNRKRYVSGAGTKYKDIKSGIRDARSVFDNKWLQLYEELTNRGISDTSAVRSKYATSLAGYMKANGLTEADMDANRRYDELDRIRNRRLLSESEKAEMDSLKETAKKMEDARDYALKQAEYATFHEDNAFADWLQKMSSSAPGIGRGIIEGVIPFKKTPANIVKTGIEYSPIGALKSIKNTVKLVSETKGRRKDYDDTYYVQTRKGLKEVHKTLANEVIEDWSKNLTGSMLAGLGYYLFSKGILNNSTSDEKYQDQLEGLQNYSITINGKTYTVDWAAPAVMPLLMGAEVAKINQEKGVSDKAFWDNPEKYLDAANRIFDPIVETSMLQGVKDTLETAANQARYNEAANIPVVLGYNALTGYATQAIPTISGQIARTVDPTRRSTYAQNDNWRGVLEKQGRKLMNKIPGLSYLNEPYYDTYGRMQNNSPFQYQSGEPVKNIGRALGNIGYQFGSPSYIANINTTDADADARQVYDDIKNEDEKAAKVYGEWTSSKKIGGERISSQEFAQYSKVKGETDYAIRDALTKNDWYKELPSIEKADILKGVSGLADKVGEASINKDFETNNKAYAAYTQNGMDGLIDYYKNQNTKNAAKDLTVSLNTSTTSNAFKSVEAKVAAGDMEGAEKLVSDYETLKKTFDKSQVLAIYDGAKNYDASLTPEQFTTTFKAIDADGNQGLKKEEIVNYLNRNHMSQSDGTKILYMYGRMTGSKAWKEVPHLEQGVWK